MKHATDRRCIQPQTAIHRSRRLTIVGLATLSFAIATADTATATSDFGLDNNTTAASFEQAGH